MHENNLHMVLNYNNVILKIKSDINLPAYTKCSYNNYKTIKIFKNMYYKKNSIELQFKKEVKSYPRCKKGVSG